MDKYARNMRRQLLLRLFLLCLCLGIYLVNCIWLKPLFPGNILLTCYLNDLLVMPVILSFGGIIFILNGGKQFSLPVLIGFTIICALFWEVGGLLFVKGSSADFWDVPVYLLGSLLYICLRHLADRPLH